MELWRFIAVVVFFSLVGVVFSQAYLFFVMGLVLMVAWQFYQLFRFATWYLERKHEEPPKLYGVWDLLKDRTYSELQKVQKQKKRVRKALRNFRAFSQALPDATVILNKRNEIIWCNNPASVYFGLDARTDIDKPITELVTWKKFVDFLNKEDYSMQLNMHPPGNEALRLNIQVVNYASKTKLLVARDVTRLFRLESMRRDFVGNVSHELRTPLSVIVGYAEMLAGDREIPEIQRDMLGKMQGQAARMQSIIEDLLTLSRLETTQPSLAEQFEVDVAGLITGLLSQVSMLSEAKKLHMKLDIATECALIGNHGELQSAFLNLISNAIRYTQPGGEITVRWYTDSRGGHFEVHDNGIGIARKHISRLTERFYRVEKDRSRETGGTGLGLAIVKYILERHDAVLAVESELGKGSLFACEFPESRLVKINTRSQVDIESVLLAE